MDKYKCPFWKVCTDKNRVVAMSKNITYKILFFYKKIEAFFHSNTKRHTHRFNMERFNMALFENAKHLFPEEYWLSLKQALCGPYKDHVCKVLKIYFGILDLKDMQGQMVPNDLPVLLDLNDLKDLLEKLQREQSCKDSLCNYKDSLYNYKDNLGINPDISWETIYTNLTENQKIVLDTLTNEHTNAAKEAANQRIVVLRLTRVYSYNSARCNNAVHVPPPDYFD